MMGSITVPDQPDPRECSAIAADGIYLCDTGGQYKDGTTDITRTLHFGAPSEEEKRCYTRCEATKQLTALCRSDSFDCSLRKNGNGLSLGKF